MAKPASEVLKLTDNAKDKVDNKKVNDKAEKEDTTDKEVLEETVVQKKSRPKTKGYRTLHPKSGDADESEGESDSEDPSIVWRGLTPADVKDIRNGLKASTKEEGDNLYSEIKEHVENGSLETHRDTGCHLMSASRSKKVAAHYASSKLPDQGVEPSRIMVKIKIDTNVKCIDLTDEQERQKVRLKAVAERWVQNAQEVIIHSNVPRKNILGFYKVYKYYGQGGLKKYKNDSKNAVSEREQFVKFRPVERDTYFGYGLTALKSNKPTKAKAPAPGAAAAVSFSPPSRKRKYPFN